VEGLSGVQFATGDAADALASLASSSGSGFGRDRSVGRSPYVLLAAFDPANLYGSGAPFDVPLLDGGSARLPRSAGNFLVLRDGRPVLIIEAFGKRLTGLPSADPAEIAAALALLPSLAGPARRILKVETYNGTPSLASPVAGRLEEIGFVRDYPGMAFYAGWSTSTGFDPDQAGDRTS
jgi:ATP-dependent Lhr-like helicase